MVQTHLAVEFEAAGFDSEEQKRWRRQDAVKRRTVLSQILVRSIVYTSATERLIVCII